MAGPPTLSDRNFSQRKGVNAADGVVATDLGTVGQIATARAGATADANAYTDGQIAGLTSGQTPKGNIRAYTATNVSITSPGSTIDGLTPQAGQVFWLGGQTTGSENGPWVWNGATSAMTRPANWNTQAKAVIGSYWIVNEGTSADSFLLLANDSFTLGTTTAVAKLVGIAQAAVVDGYTAQCPLVNAGGTWTVTHGLNTRNLIVQFYRVASPFDYVDPPAFQRTSVNQLTISPDAALAAGEYEIMVKKVV